MPYMSTVKQCFVLTFTRVQQTKQSGWVFKDDPSKDSKHVFISGPSYNTPSHTVDGSEILRQLRLVVYPIIYRVHHPRWLFGISSINSRIDMDWYILPAETA